MVDIPTAEVVASSQQGKEVMVREHRVMIYPPSKRGWTVNGELPGDDKLDQLSVHTAG